MKEMSEPAGLLNKYTDYSVRATAITLWPSASLPNRHRNEQSLRSYTASPSSAQPLPSSDVLSNALGVTLVPSTSRQIHSQAPQAQI